MKQLKGFALCVLPLALPAVAWAQNGAGVQHQPAHAFAAQPHGNTNAFSATPNGTTRAFAHTPKANTSALGGHGAAQASALGYDGQSVTAAGSTSSGTANARRAAKSFAVGSDNGASSAGGHQ